jgi:hypothetical protein
MMQKKLLNLGLLILLVTGCKLSAFNQGSAANEDSVSQTGKTETAFNSINAEPAATPKPAPQTRQANAVCSDPAKPCQHSEKEFDVWELSFKLPAKLKANKPYHSAPFYAVILKTYTMDDDCDGGEYIEAVEKDRRREQKDQLERKVFASYECPNMSAVNYEFEGKWDTAKERLVIGNFIALYAGETKEAGEETLRLMKNEYPKAMLKRMTAIVEKIEQ